MHISELVLEDFKSFGRKTRIPFYEDFTTISGPNGTGKSNIIDSILFALGLARTSGIRAEKLTDLIYNPGHEDGAEFSGEREAWVEVVLDNADGTLERSQVVNAAGTDDVGDVDEISIRRRVKQTDEDTYYSYYYLNGRSVNLGDIQDLLAQAGVTPEGYNVVMQGDVTEIITVTAGNRRAIVDEIAGVAEFDAKKEEAFGELETVSERIDEAELRIEEKEARLDQLEDERETAIKYRELKEEKATYEGYRKAAELENKREELEATREEVEAAADRLAERQRELDERQGRVTRLEDELDELNAEIERKGEDEQLELKAEMEEIKGDISRLEDRIESAEDRVEDAENARRQAFVDIDRREETVEELAEEIRRTKVRKADLTADRQEKAAELEDVEAEIEAVDADYEELREAIEATRQQLSTLRDEKNELQREQDRLLDEARRRSNDQREKEQEIEAAEAEIPELDDEIADLEAELAKAEENSETIAEVVADLKREKRELLDEIEDVEDEMAAKQQEYADLEAKADDDGDSAYGRAVTAVLNAGFDGVHGTVAQLGGVDAEYATACETAAGGRMAHVVVDDDGVGERCIEHLKSRNAGRGTFLPLSEMEARSLPSVPNRPGVVDFASELVDFDPTYAGVFSYVLGDTLVVEDMETALELMGEFRLVTLEGDLVETSGAMTGGSTSGSRYSFSKSGTGRLERVAEQIEELEDRRRELREELRDVEDRLDDARDRQSDARDKVREIEATLERRRDEREDAAERIADLEDELDEIEAERESVAAEMEALEEDIDEKTAEIRDAEDDVEELERELKDSEIPELTERAEAIREELADLDAEIDDLDGDLNELQLEKGYAEDAIEELREEVEAARDQKAEAEDAIEEHEAAIAEHEERLAEKEAQIAELEDAIADLKDERESLKDDLREARRARDEQTERVTEAKSELAELRDRADRLEWEIEELEAEVGDYDEEAIPSHQAVKGQITKLENRMAELEPVNMLAIEEYDDVAADLEDLRDKRSTLVEEADGIRERIERYESRKKETFMEAFEGINEHFEDIFAQLSDGTGTLVLENEADPFDGGLTMKARPADKPVQRLDAMSGGEKSLTALAFIFAIQRYNPAPFYALDEIDAFLDAANAEMVGEMVDDLAGDAQFIVVSHRSALLERSERAIGVTMPEENVSAVTGIELSGEGVPADD